MAYGVFEGLMDCQFDKICYTGDIMLINGYNMTWHVAILKGWCDAI